MTELRALTGARGIAAWFVVLYHIRASIAGLPPFWLGVFAKGYLAVDFFFLLSGFVIWLSYGSRIRSEGWRAVPGFLRKRIARIWPLHLFVLTCAIGLALVLAASGRADPAFPFPELPLHVLLLQNWGFTRQLAWNVPAWSISAELFAYLLFPLLAITIDWRKFPSVVVLVTIGMLIEAMATFMAIRGVSQLGEFVPQLGLIRCIVEFTCGTALAALYLRWRATPRYPAMAAILIAIAAFAAFLSGAIVEIASVPIGFSAALLLLAFSAGTRGNPLEMRLVHYLGEISFATYLGHFLLWKAFKLVFVSNAGAVPPGLIALYLVLVLASSAALYHLIERPAQRWINGARLGRFPAKAGAQLG